MQITTRLLCFVVLLCLLGIPSRAGNPTIPEKNNLWYSPPSGCELPAPGNVQVTALGPDFADLDWDDVPGASGYQAVLTDLTVSPNISISTNTTSSNISYNASLITPGHTYKFEVASICTNNQIGAYSASVTFTAPVIIVVIDIVTRQCTPSTPADVGLHFLPNNIGYNPGTAVSFDLIHNGAVFGFEAQTMPNGHLRFDVNSESYQYGFNDFCIVTNTVGCSNVGIRRVINGTETLIASFSPQTIGTSRYLKVNYLLNGATLRKCAPGRGLVAPSGIGMLGQQSVDAPQATDDAPLQGTGQASLQATPNPFSHTLDLRFKLPKSSSIAKLAISDMNGRVVYQETLGTQLVPGEYTHTCMLTDLDSGVYLLTLLTEQGLLSQRILKP
ncbi:MAG: T9SS type A sorting domain-containing protein [Chitinophagales bacterium]|nr:T9SS type A sorting domain-containing protein [Chitinophagales bacterium]